MKTIGRERETVENERSTSEDSPDEPAKKPGSWDTLTEEEARALRPAWLKIRPPSDVVCTHCGSDWLSALPTFSTGAGIAHRPGAEDVYCRRCGYIGLPTTGERASGEGA